MNTPLILPFIRSVIKGVLRAGEALHLGVSLNQQSLAHVPLLGVKMSTQANKRIHSGEMKDTSFRWVKLKDALLHLAAVTQAWPLRQDPGWRLSARIFELKRSDWPIAATRDDKARTHYFPTERMDTKGNSAPKESSGGTSRGRNTNKENPPNKGEPDESRLYPVRENHLSA